MPEVALAMSAREFEAMLRLVNQGPPPPGMPLGLAGEAPSAETLQALHGRGLLGPSGDPTEQARALLQIVSPAARASQWTFGRLDQIRKGWHCTLTGTEAQPERSVYCDWTPQGRQGDGHGEGLGDANADGLWQLDGSIRVEDVARMALWWMGSGEMPDLPSTSIELSAQESVAIAFLADRVPARRTDHPGLTQLFADHAPPGWAPSRARVAAGVEALARRGWASDDGTGPRAIGTGERLCMQLCSTMPYVAVAVSGPGTGQPRCLAVRGPHAYGVFEFGGADGAVRLLLGGPEVLGALLSTATSPSLTPPAAGAPKPGRSGPDDRPALEVRCANCKNIVPDTKFCRQCGQPLAAQEQTSRAADDGPALEVRCANCKNVVPRTKFCQQCGQPLVAEEATASNAQPQAGPRPSDGMSMRRWLRQLQRADDDLLSVEPGHVVAVAAAIRAMREERLIASDALASMAASAFRMRGPNGTPWSVDLDTLRWTTTLSGSDSGEPPPYVGLEVAFDLQERPARPKPSPSPQASSPPGDRACANCGTVLVPGKKFCPACGTKVATPGEA